MVMTTQPVSRRHLILTGGVGMAGAGMLSILAACGRTAPPAAQPAGARTIAAAKLVAMLRSGPEELEAMSKAIAAFEGRFPQLTVEKVLATPDSPYDVKTDTLIAGGTPPALWFPAANRGYRFHAAAKQTESLDDLIARDKYDLSDFFPGPLAFCKWEGKYNCLPMFVVPPLLIWNETLFQSAGAPAPSLNWQDRAWNWDRFLAAAQRITRRGADPAASQFGAQIDTGRFSEQVHGGDFFDDPAYDSGYPDPTKFRANRPAVIQAWEFLHSLIYRSQVQPTDEQFAILRGTLPNVFLSGKVGMLSTNSGFLATGARIQGFKWRTAALPAPAALPRRNWFFADQWVMMRGQANRDAAWELLKHMESAEAQRLYAVGLGRLAARKSLADEWAKFHKGATGLSDADIKVATDAIAVSRITPSHALVHYARIYGEAINPERIKLFKNETGVNAALDAIVPLAVNIIRETNPKR